MLLAPRSASGDADALRRSPSIPTTQGFAKTSERRLIGFCVVCGKVECVNAGFHDVNGAMHVVRPPANFAKSQLQQCVVVSGACVPRMSALSVGEA